MIRFRYRGGFNNAESFLKKAKNTNPRTILEKYANEGVTALSSATPKDSGLTSEKWSYEIVKKGSGFSIYWTNDNFVDGIPIVILLQYGHGTRGGTFVQGRDFINPTMRPIFDRLAENLWKEVADL